jgi:hypothetical protein
MTATRFAASPAARVLLVASDQAAARDAELRLVIMPRCCASWRSWGWYLLLQIYPSLGSALTAGPPAHGRPRL